MEAIAKLLDMVARVSNDNGFRLIWICERWCLYQSGDQGLPLSHLLDTIAMEAYGYAEPGTTEALLTGKITKYTFAAPEVLSRLYGGVDCLFYLEHKPGIGTQVLGIWRDDLKIIHYGVSLTLFLLSGSHLMRIDELKDWAGKPDYQAMVERLEAEYDVLYGKLLESIPKVTAQELSQETED